MLNLSGNHKMTLVKKKKIKIKKNIIKKQKQNQEGVKKLKLKKDIIKSDINSKNVLVFSKNLKKENEENLDLNGNIKVSCKNKK